jgi:multiple sugar transport system permease protein
MIDTSSRHSLGVRRENTKLSFLWLPAVFWYTFFTVGPLLAMFYISLLEWPGLIAENSFVGLSNFEKLASDDVFWQAFRNSLIQIAVVLPILLPTSFMLGYYLSQKPPGHRLLRVILFTPALISLSAKSTMFLAIFAPLGLINSSLELVGLGALSTPWLASSSTAFGTVMAVELWGGIGFTAILFAARLSGVTPDVFEAAALDGAGHWKRIWAIAFPICREYVGVIAMLQFIWVMFGSAGLILLLTRGGPGNYSTNLSFLVYDTAFSQQQIGYSQAIAVVLFAIVLAGIALIRFSFRAKE